MKKRKYFLVVQDLKDEGWKCVVALMEHKHLSVPGHSGLRVDTEWTEVFVLVRSVVDRRLWRDPGTARRPCLFLLLCFFGEVQALPKSCAHTQSTQITAQSLHSWTIMYQGVTSPSEKNCSGDSGDWPHNIRYTCRNYVARFDPSSKQASRTKTNLSFKWPT